MRWIGLLTLAGLIAGCGAGGSGAPPAPRKAVSQAPLLVELQRRGRVTATLDQLRVRADGHAEIDRRYGGAGRRVTPLRLKPQVIRAVRREVASLPDDPEPGGAPAAAGTGYTYYLHWGSHATSAVTGAVPVVLRPLIHRLDGVIDGRGRASVGAIRPGATRPQS